MGFRDEEDSLSDRDASRFWKAEATTGIFNGPAGLKYLYINEIDANNVSILTALQNLNPGDSMTFTILYDATIS